jgi:hypothetical protein
LLGIAHPGHRHFRRHAAVAAPVSGPTAHKWRAHDRAGWFEAVTVSQRQRNTVRHCQHVSRSLVVGKVIVIRVSDGRQTPNFQRPAVKAESSEQAARIRTLAETLNRDEICEKEGISLGRLKGIGRRYKIEFQAGPKKAYAPNKVTPESEALLVIRVKDCMAKKINRAQCAKALGISTTLLLRLISDYEIDYPKMKPAFR